MLRYRAGRVAVGIGVTLSVQVPPPSAGVAVPTSSFESWGYRVEWRPALWCGGAYLVDGVEVSRARCHAAGEGCGEVIEVAWVVQKVEADP